MSYTIKLIFEYPEDKLDEFLSTIDSKISRNLPEKRYMTIYYLMNSDQLKKDEYSTHPDLAKYVLNSKDWGEFLSNMNLNISSEFTKLNPLEVKDESCNLESLLTFVNNPKIDTIRLTPSDYLRLKSNVWDIPKNFDYIDGRKYIKMSSKHIELFNNLLKMTIMDDWNYEKLISFLNIYLP